MSATPRTDAAVELARPLGADPMPPAREYVHAEFARQLERENAALLNDVKNAADRLLKLERENVALREDKAMEDEP